MALEPPSDPVARARDLAREQDSERWSALSERIREQARSITRPAEPMLVSTAGDGARTRVSSRIVTARLRRLLQRQATHAPAAIDLVITDERLVEVSVDLVCSFGPDLHLLAEQVRDEIRGALHELADLEPERVDIRVVDVVDGDPRVV